MRIPFVGPAYKLASVNQSAQRCVNLFLEQTEQGGKTQAALYRTPGKIRRVTVGSGAIRGLLAFGPWLYAVSGDGVYRIGADYAATLLGTIGTTINTVGMACNGSQVLIVDGAAGWIITASSGTLAQITASGFPNGVTWAKFLDGYFIVGGDGTQRFYISAQNDGMTWDALDYASAEGSPSDNVAGEVDHRELFMFSSDSVEIFVDTGNATFPIERSGNAFIEVGCSAAASVAKLDNSIFWLGTDKRGEGIVWRLNGYTPVRVSDHGVETAIAGYSVISDAIAYAYQQRGHMFYVLSFPSAGATWVYDVATQSWHERAYMNQITGQLGRDRGQCYALFGRDHLIGDYADGRIYALSLDAYDDDGDVVKWVRTCAPQDSDNNQVFYQSIEIDIEAGVGLQSGQGSDPVVMLRWSDDGGHSWCNTKQMRIGAIGRYGYRAKREQLGAGRNRVWELSGTDPVKIVIMGAIVRATAADR